MNKDRTLLILSLALAIIVGSVSFVGLWTPGFYQLESENWQAQAIGQDLLDLFLITPVLLISAAIAYWGNRMGKMVWAGTNIYLVYTFAIYAFAVHFNSMFFLYCLGLGLAFYSLVYFFFSETRNPINEIILRKSVRVVTGVYFIITAVLFYGLWLSDVFPAMLSNVTPESLVETGLITNPVHVLDLAIVLPALAIIGFLLLRQQHMGFLLAPVMLVFTLLMNLTIAGLNFLMDKRGLEANWPVTMIMFILAIFSFILLITFWKAYQKNHFPVHAA